jgi:hypothetical protein
MCQWDVHEPTPAPVAGLVPLPPPRPKIEENGSGARNKRAVDERNGTLNSEATLLRPEIARPGASRVTHSASYAS